MAQTQTSTTTGARVPQWTFADRLRKARKEACMSQETLAEATNIARSTINNYETGNTQPKKTYVKILAMATGVDHMWLWDGSMPGDLRDPSTICNTKVTQIHPHAA